MASYILGIDLGTTNSVLAYCDLAEENPQVELFPIPQLVAAGAVEKRTSLPSFTYLAGNEENEHQSLALPWSGSRDFAVGEFARSQSADVPHRTVGAAKSWLAHSKVDRRQPILPHNAPKEVKQISPLEASRRYLAHLVEAWESAHPEALVREQMVVLTVPASFDAAARELTREAAVSAGLPESLVLLEEPQAAVYAWLGTEGDKWRKKLKVGESLLVCDVGGGTTDLSLIAVAEENGDLILKRLAVGNHLLVGGDNMDLALAHHAAGLFAKKKVQLDPWQSVSLWHSCRAAKETLLSEDGPAKHPISVLGRGSKLIGGTVTVEVAKKEVSQLLLDGFFPACAAEERPIRPPASGFQEIGLAYESDPAITRHLAAFLQSQAGDAPVQPTHVLFNGGVFKSAALQQRLLEVLTLWSGNENPPRPLHASPDLDHAVARGAAFYGLAKQQGGVRIRGGVARSYYVGIETAGMAVPGAARPLRALCVVPFGMEEGTEADVPSGEIGLIVGEPAQFRFFSSTVRKEDRPGDLLPHIPEEELQATDSLEATLPREEESSENTVPVRFQSKITELGVLELWCVHAASNRRWKLEFSVREEAE